MKDEIINVLKDDLENLTRKQLRSYASKLKKEEPATDKEQIMLSSAIDMLYDDLSLKLNVEGVKMIATVEYERAVKGEKFYCVTTDLKRLYTNK